MGERINIHEYIDMIKRRRLLIVVIILISLLFGVYKTYRNYVSYEPRYRSHIVIKVDSMKVQKEEAAKQRKENKSDSGESDTSGDYDTGYFNYGAISQDESISTRYYSYLNNSGVYPKIAQVAGVRAKMIESISASTDEERPEMITVNVTSSEAKSAQMIANAVPEVFGTELLKETGLDCVVVVYEATQGTLIQRGRDLSIVKYTMAGLVLSVFIVLLLECLNTKIITPDDVEKYWELPLLGVVPMYDEPPRKDKNRK